MNIFESLFDSPADMQELDLAASNQSHMYYLHNAVAQDARLKHGGPAAAMPYSFSGMSPEHVQEVKQSARMAADRAHVWASQAHAEPSHTQLRQPKPQAGDDGSREGHLAQIGLALLAALMFPQYGGKIAQTTLEYGKPKKPDDQSVEEGELGSEAPETDTGLPEDEPSGLPFPQPTGSGGNPNDLYSTLQAVGRKLSGDPQAYQLLAQLGSRLRL